MEMKAVLVCVCVCVYVCVCVCVSYTELYWNQYQTFVHGMHASVYVHIL